MERNQHDTDGIMYKPFNICSKRV